MNMYINIAEQDIIFLSYDEPNAEKNYVDLVKKVPWAKRVHGVEGSDAAHKACAELSETKHFVTVDGDTIIDPNFLNVKLDLYALGVDDDYQFSWCGKVNINGLMYGNGSLKMWTKDFVSNMRTHENTDGNDDTMIEFCYFDNYYQLNDNYSESIINSTKAQAFRAGFREGVKMSLNRGAKVTNLAEDVWWQNYHRLLIWMNVGTDVDNGIWAIYGAREGCHLALTDWDVSQTRDFTILNKMWDEKYSKVKDDEIYHNVGELGFRLKELDLPLSEQPLTADQSKFFKTVYINTDRVIGTNPSGMSARKMKKKKPINLDLIKKIKKMLLNEFIKEAEKNQMIAAILKDHKVRVRVVHKSIKDYAYYVFSSLCGNRGNIYDLAGFSLAHLR